MYMYENISPMHLGSSLLASHKKGMMLCVESSGSSCVYFDTTSHTRRSLADSPLCPKAPILVEQRSMRSDMYIGLFQVCFSCARIDNRHCFAKHASMS